VNIRLCIFTVCLLSRQYIRIIHSIFLLTNLYTSLPQNIINVEITFLRKTTIADLTLTCKHFLCQILDLTLELSKQRTTININNSCSMLLQRRCVVLILNLLLQRKNMERLTQGQWLDTQATVSPYCVIYYSSVGHHLFADDTQLFISYRTPELSANILNLQNTIDLVSQCLNGCLLIFSHSINLKLNFFLLVYLLNYLKSLILLF